MVQFLNWDIFPPWLCFNNFLKILDTADGTATREYDIPVLSGSAFIGQLYDATKDQLLMDRYLWQLPIVVNEANITSVKTKMYLEEKITDRYDHLDVSASISASLYSGLIEVSLDFELPYSREQEHVSVSDTPCY